MKAAKIIVAILAVCVSSPIWYVLVYHLLASVETDRLLWFLFWIYVPLGILLSIVRSVLEVCKDEKP